MLHVYILFTILIIAIALFIWGYWRYDVVALIALMLATLTGVVPFKSAFSGFSNPAVVTVASVMMITHTITETGVIDYVVKKILPFMRSTYVYVAILSVMTAILSAFMNNVGALALMMPIAIQASVKYKRSPSLILMPIAFSSVLGGLTTAIGTPPNLLISSFRQQAIGISYNMFDFTPVGLTVAIVGLLFIIFLGWRFIPKRKSHINPFDLFQMQDYITEIRIPASSPMVGQTLNKLTKIVEAEFLVLGMIRKKHKRLRLDENELLQAEDVLIIQASHNDLEKVIIAAKLELVAGEKVTSEILRSDNISLIEAVVPQGSRMEGRNAVAMRLKHRYGINLLAIARQGNPFKERLQQVNLKAGDVVLLQGHTSTILESTANLGLLPLVERGVKVGLPKSSFFSLLVFFLAIVLTAVGVLPVEVAFVLAVVVLMIFNTLPLRNAYQSVDWSVIILLGALIPLGQALESTGATQLIANFIVHYGSMSPAFLLVLIFIITMTLSDLMNNAATAVVMAPIAISIANTLGLSIDPFLMTVAISSSCSFLTPISHQNNTLVMGPGGYKFFDYLKVGLLLEVIIVCIAIPTIIFVWPF